MTDKDAVTLAEELERAFPAGGTIGARLSDQMFRRILSALRQPATERADAGGLGEVLTWLREQKSIYAGGVSVPQSALIAIADLIERKAALKPTEPATEVTAVQAIERQLNWSCGDDCHEDERGHEPRCKAAREGLTRLQAENARLRKALIEAGREAGAILSDTVSNDFLMLVPGEVKAKIATLGGSDA